MAFPREEGGGPRACSPIHAVGCRHHPVSPDEGPSAGVMPAATGVILEGDLGKEESETWGGLTAWSQGDKTPMGFTGCPREGLT